MMNRDTFTHGMKLVHNALYKLHRPEDADEFMVIKELINGFIAMLGDFDADAFKAIKAYLVEHDEIIDDEVYLLYTYIFIDNCNIDVN